MIFIIKINKFINIKNIIKILKIDNSLFISNKNLISRSSLKRTLILEIISIIINYFFEKFNYFYL